MNTIECQAGDGPVRRGDAVIRGDLRVQRAWHPDCFTVARAVNGIDAPAAEPPVDFMALTRRLAALRG